MICLGGLLLKRLYLNNTTLVTLSSGPCLQANMPTCAWFTDTLTKATLCKSMKVMKQTDEFMQLFYKKKKLNEREKSKQVYSCLLRTCIDPRAEDHTASRSRQLKSGTASIVVQGFAKRLSQTSFDPLLMFELELEGRVLIGSAGVIGSI